MTVATKKKDQVFKARFLCDQYPGFRVYVPNKEGVSIKFRQGTYETNDAEEIKFLDNSPIVQGIVRRDPGKPFYMCTLCGDTSPVFADQNTLVQHLKEAHK